MDLLIKLDRTLFMFAHLDLNSNYLFNIAYFLVQKKFLLTIALFMSIYSIRNYGPKAILLILVSIIMIGINEEIVNFLKESIGRLRPFVVMGDHYNPNAFSFPSAHATNTMALTLFWGAIITDKPHKWVWFSFIIGIARSLSGYHFPLDIFAGWFLGWLIGWVGVYLVKYTQKSLFISSIV